MQDPKIPRAAARENRRAREPFVTVAINREFDPIVVDDADLLKLVTCARRQREDKAPSILNIEPQQPSCETISRLAGGDRIPIDQQTVIFHRQLDGLEREIARHHSRPRGPELGRIKGYTHYI